MNELRRRLVIACFVALSSSVLQAAPFQPNNYAVHVWDDFNTSSLREVSGGGAILQAFNIPHVAGQISTEHARSIAVSANGDVQIYNGTFTPYLSTFHPASATYEHHRGIGFDTVNNSNFGGLATLGRYVYVTDWNIFTSPDSGIVRFDLTDFSSQRFALGGEYARLTIGGDGLLYANRGGSPSSSFDVYDPSSMQLVRSFALPVNPSQIAVDTNGEIFAFAAYTVYRLSPAGAIVASKVVTSGIGGQNLANDIALAANGELILGTKGGKVVITDREFNSPQTYFVGFPDHLGDYVYVSAVTPIPEPAMCVVGALCLCLTTRRTRTRVRTRLQRK